MSRAPAATSQSRVKDQEELAWLSLTQSTTVQAPVPFTLLTDNTVVDMVGVLFLVPATRSEPKPILFRRYRDEDFPRYRSEEDHRDPDYSWVSPKVAGMM